MVLAEPRAPFHLCSDGHNKIFIIMFLVSGIYEAHHMLVCIERQSPQRCDFVVEHSYIFIHLLETYLND